MPISSIIYVRVKNIFSSQYSVRTFLEAIEPVIYLRLPNVKIFSLEVSVLKN